MNRHSNHFDLLRLLAAFMVLYSHSFAAYGVGPDPLKAVDPWDSFGTMAVYIFFVISGYLVSASLDYNQSLWTFTKNRALRIFPALIALTLFTVFIVGPVMTSLSISEYFQAKDTYKYLNNIFIFPMRYALPGVFTDHPVAGIVNTSLWSLELELRCYIVLGLLFAITLFRPIVILGISMIGALLFVYFLNMGENHPTHLLGVKWQNCLNYTKYAAFFMGGSACYFYRNFLSSKAAWLAALGLVLLPGFLYPHAVSYLLRIPAVIFLVYGIAHLPYGIIGKKQRMDISYGVYLYGSVIQQSFWHFVGKNVSFAMYIILCAIIVTLFAIASWFLVEKPCLALKKKSLHADLKENAAAL